MKFYYGLIEDSYGFIDEYDERLTPAFIELTEEEYGSLLEEQSEGKEIVSYNGEVFTAPPGLYYVGEDNEWHKKDDEEFNIEQLEEAKAYKYGEVKRLAYAYLESGEALYEFEEGKHVEATDGNIAKFTAYALGFASGSTDPVAWCTKEDETVFLNQEQVVDILQGLGAVQAQVWTVKFTNYVQQIEEASTVEEVEAIVIDYSQDIEPSVGEPSEEEPEVEEETPEEENEEEEE